MNIEHQRYLIIGGTPKAGTTSVYRWLSDHPQVCASSLKETRFFLDANYPLSCAKRFTGNNLKDYSSFFKQCSEDCTLVRLDVTPDYLYSKMPLFIADALPYAKIVFILRDPVERMISWYKYSRQRGLIGKKMNFEDYVMTQVRNPIEINTPTHLRALEQCRYEKYLPEFRETFGTRCLVAEFNDLKTNPYQFMARLCDFVGVENSFYDNYQFNAENVSQEANNIWITRYYNSMRRGFAHSFHSHPAVFEILRKLNQPLKKRLVRHNKAAESFQISDAMDTLIRNQISSS